MKLFTVDLTNNFTVRSVADNVSNYKETYRDDGAVVFDYDWYTYDTVEHQWMTIHMNGTIDPTTTEFVLVDDSVQVSTGDSALNEPLFDYFLAKRKQRKIHELTVAWQNASFGGFTVSSTGYTYASSSDDQLRITMQAAHIMMFPQNYPDNYTFIWDTTSNGAQPHTVAQFKDVFDVLHSFTKTNNEKFWNLKDQVNQATTLDQVNAISW